MSTTESRGLFISFEGGDGSGKTTQIRRLAARLRAAGHETVETVEPGGTPIGRQIRQILLDPANNALDARAELLLYFASRAQNVHELILPALAAGKVVVCDRFTDSTLVYQGYGRGLGEAFVHRLHEIACGTIEPDLTFYLDIDLETALGRALARNREQSNTAESRMDEQPVAFHREVRDAYLDLAARHFQRIVVIDARPDEATIERSIWETLAPRLEKLRAL